MAVNPKFCSICDLRHISKPATDWCSECEQAFCTECKDFHGLSRLSQNHRTISLTDFQALAPSVASISNFCIDHQDKYQLFCQVHVKLLCLTCLDEHFECKDVTRLSKMTENIKTSETFRDTLQSLNDISSNIARVPKGLQENLDCIKEQKEGFVTEINQIRMKINNHLDIIEQTLKLEISDLETKLNSDIRAIVKTLEEKELKISESQQEMEKLRKYGSDLQAFYGVRQISSEATKTEQFLQSMIEDGSLDKVLLQCNIDGKMKDIMNDIQKFGSIQVQKTPSNLALERQKDKQAQLVGTLHKSINDIKVNLIQRINTKGHDVRGCNILPDGKMIFSDYSEGKDCIITTDSNGKHLFEISMKSTSDAYDVTCIDEKTVAVTSGMADKKCVNIVDIVSRKVIKTIPTDYKCFGITCNEDSLVYCSEKPGIQMINLKDEKITTILHCNIPSYTNVASFEDKLYYTNHLANTVTCINLQGKTLWTYKDALLKQPIGISVDNFGNVYVAGRKKDNVMVLSSDGKLSKGILAQKDGLSDVYSLHYDRINNRLLVSSKKDMAFLFDISW